MALTGKVDILCPIGGQNIKISYAHDDKGVEAHPLTLAAGFDGALNASNSVVTGLATNHGMTNASKVAVFGLTWRRYNISVTAAGANTITLDTDGSGDNIPGGTNQAVVTAPKQTIADISFAGTSMLTLAASCDQRCQFSLRDSNAAELMPFEIKDSYQGYMWTSGIVAATPFNNAVASCYVWPGSTSAATFKIAAVLNS